MQKNQILVSPSWSNVHLEELTNEELTVINGGESAWYWIAYGVGWFNHAASPGANEYDRIRRESGFGK